MVYRYYNLTNMTSVGNNSNIMTFVGNVNSELNYVPATLIMVAIFIVLFLILIKQGFDSFKSLAASGFVAMILSIIVYPSGLITGATLITFCIICPITMFMLWVFG